MVKRLISANTSEVLAMNSAELKQSIRASEGRVVLSENVATRESFIGDITNTEIAHAFGADMILLNGVDVLNPNIFALDSKEGEFVHDLHHLVGCPIGVNLEPVDLDAELQEDRLEIVEGRQATDRTFREVEALGFDFVCLTGNPGTGVSNETVIAATKKARELFSGLIIAGKMHNAGVNEAIIDVNISKQLLEAGADIILAPAVGTVPGFGEDELIRIVKEVHKEGGLVLSAIGTSQESSDFATIRDIALKNKVCGVDIQHIGDAGYGGVAPVENIYELSKAIRGVRHTVSRMARSINR